MPCHGERPIGERNQGVANSNTMSIKATLRAKTIAPCKVSISHLMSRVVSCLFLLYFTKVSFCTELEIVYMPTSPSTQLALSVCMGWINAGMHWNPGTQTCWTLVTMFSLTQGLSWDLKVCIHAWAEAGSPRATFHRTDPCLPCLALTQLYHKKVCLPINTEQQGHQGL